MHIRCGSCHGSIWVEIADFTAQQLPVQCPTCKKNYVLEGPRAAEAAGARLSAEARQLAREAQLDLPSAYSVLLGAMSLEEVLELGDFSSTTTPGDKAHSPSAKSAYDPAFQPSVDAGLLTPLQAMQRGNRKRYAKLVSGRHRLPDEVGLAVADNSISLLEALRRRGPDAVPDPVRLTVGSEPQSRSRLPLVVVVAVVILVVTGAVFQSFQTSAPTAAVGSAVRSVLGAQVRTDEFGRIIEVFAADPKSVLAAYCASDREGRYEPIDLIPTSDAGAGGRLGLLRRTGRSGELLSITVREDRDGNRWVAGDGKSPVVPRTAPRAAAEAIQQR